MTKYNCDICVYSTTRKTEYTRHTNTKKHKEKVSISTSSALDVHKTCISIKHKCPFCENLYSSSSTLARHKKACGVKDKLVSNETIKDKEIERLQKQVETYELYKYRLYMYYKKCCNILTN